MAPPHLTLVKTKVLNLKPTIMSGGRVLGSTTRFGKDGTLGPTTWARLNAFC